MGRRGFSGYLSVSAEVSTGIVCHISSFPTKSACCNSAALRNPHRIMRSVWRNTCLARLLPPTVSHIITVVVSFYSSTNYLLLTCFSVSYSGAHLPLPRITGYLAFLYFIGSRHCITACLDHTRLVILYTDNRCYIYNYTVSDS